MAKREKEIQGEENRAVRWAVTGMRVRVMTLASSAEVTLNGDLDDRQRRQQEPEQ